MSEQSKGNKCAPFEIIIFGPYMAAGQVGYFTTRFHPMCSHLQINPFVRRMQELLLPEHVVYFCSCCMINLCMYACNSLVLVNCFELIDA